MLAPNRSDILKLLAYIAATLLLGALVAPWLYNAGKAFAEIFAGKQAGGFTAWLADACRRSEFPRFFDRAVLLAAALLLVPAIHWLRIGKPKGKFRDTPWSLRAAEPPAPDIGGQPLRRNPRGPLQAATGFLLAASLLLLIGHALLASGWFKWRSPTPSLLHAAADALPSTLVVAVVEEIIFRGILLGIFLRAMRPAFAIPSLAFLFAFLHFLKPPPGITIANPESAWAGLQLLGHILGRFAAPLPLATEFATLFAVGAVLGHARWRTASLWLPVGLHAGWVFGMLLFKALTWPSGPPLDHPSRLFIGLTLRDGLIPAAVVVATGLLVHVFTPRQDHPTPPHA